MEIVLDTNVLVARLLNPTGKPGEIVDREISCQITLAYNDRIILEYHSVQLRPGFGFDKDGYRRNSYGIQGSWTTVDHTS